MPSCNRRRQSAASLKWRVLGLAALLSAVGEAANSRRRRSAGNKQQDAEELSAQECLDTQDAGQLYELGAASLARGGVSGGNGAQECFRRAAQTQPLRHEGWLGLGRLAEAMKKPRDAEELYRKAFSLTDGRDTEPMLRLGSLLMGQQRYAEAEVPLRRAAGIDTRNVGVAYNLGLTLLYQHKYEGARDAFLQAEARDPSYVDTQLNLGAVLFGIGDFDAAVNHLRKAIKLQPDSEHGWRNLGAALAKQEEWGEASAALERYLAIIAPAEDADIAVRVVFCRQQAADWSRWDADNAAMTSAVQRALREGLPMPTSPFNALSMPAISARLSLDIARAKAAEVAAAAGPPLKLPQRRKRGEKSHGPRLRIGYVSPDFREHPVGSIMQHLVAQHDRTAVEVFCYAINPDSGSAVRAATAAAAEHFVDVNALSAAEAAERIAADGVQVLVNLGGYTQYMRNEIFALRPAPVQALFLGYAASMGADFMQYVIADAAAVPPSLEGLYTEKIAHLSGALLPLSHRHRLAMPSRTAGPDAKPGAVAEQRRAVGLPPGRFVFCCFNTLYKVDPATFQSWANILARSPGSVLWLPGSPRGAFELMRREAAAAGLSPQRLVEAPWFPEEEHLRVKSLCDLFLDTPAYNAHQTAGDALWAGIPMLTLPGEKMVARVGLSMQLALGLPRSSPTIARSYAEYEDTAVRLARSPGELRPLRAQLESLRAGSVLFNLTRSVRMVEQLAALMWQHHQAGRPPEHIRLPDDSASR
eukprot:jgi/Tetstr1/444135/TSEL_032033.t1